MGCVAKTIYAANIRLTNLMFTIGHCTKHGTTRMVRLYIEDGHPESDEFDGNCLEFDDRDPRAIRKVQERLREHKREDIASWLESFYRDALVEGPQEVRQIWRAWRAWFPVGPRVPHTTKRP
jgi:hypothetical protein